MRCDLQLFLRKETQHSPVPTVCGSHLDRGQREYSRSELRRRAVGVNPSTAFSIAPIPALPVTLRVLFGIPPMRDTCPHRKLNQFFLLRGGLKQGHGVPPRNYRASVSPFEMPALLSQLREQNQPKRTSSKLVEGSRVAVREWATGSGYDLSSNVVRTENRIPERTKVLSTHTSILATGEVWPLPAVRFPTVRKLVQTTDTTDL